MREQELDAYTQATDTFLHIVGSRRQVTVGHEAYRTFILAKHQLPQKTKDLLLRHDDFKDSLIPPDVDPQEVDWDTVEAYLTQEEPETQAAYDEVDRLFRKIHIQEIANYLRQNYTPLPVQIHTYLEQYFPEWEKET